MTGIGKYTEQLLRTERWFKRFEDIHNGSQQKLDTECYQDDVYAFFMNCYHLKDWIKNDPSLNQIECKVEPYINDNECLQLCADICNGHKHLRLDKNRSRQNPQFTVRHYHAQIGSPEGQTMQIAFEVNTSSGVRDAFEIASQCMVAWRDFVNNEITKS